MRNLKRALSLGLTATMISGLMVMGSSAASYADVTSKNHQEAIEVLKSVGIMTGDEKGNFNPEAKLTRNEMAVVMSNLMAYNIKNYANTSHFTDVPEWAEPYVAACYTNGITAGVTATTYGGSENLTTAQAALMVMKALGYFQYQSDFENDWQLSTVKQANKIDLFDDVDAGVKEDITRNQLAQLVLNALESGTVEADDDTIKVNADGVTVEAGKVKYNYITSAKDYAEAIDNKTVTNNDGTMSTGCIVELGEKLYNGDLTKKRTTDDFGRPANQWEYQAKEVGTYADTADTVFTAKVTSKKLYDAVGKTAAEDYKWTVSVDGEKVDDFSNSTLVKNKANDDADVLKDVWKGMGTGNGVITEVFVDGTDKTVDVAVIHQYAAEVLKVDEEEGTITLSDLSGVNGVADAKDEFETKDFAEDDIVIYTYANGDIQSVYAAEKIEGEVTSVRVKTLTNVDGDLVTPGDGDNFVVDGTTYKYNKTMKVGEMLDTDNVNNDVVAYMDANGYVAYVDESAVTYDYAYVLSMGSDNDKWDNDPLGTTVYARLVLTDGTVVKVETDAKFSEIPSLKNHIVSYSKDKKDIYSLTDRSHTFDLADATNLDVNNGKAGMTLVDSATEGKTSAVANANTVFIVAESDSESYDDYDFSIYTGVKNVPDIDGDADTKAVVALKDSSNVAKVVYIQDAEVSGATDVVFAYADKTPKYTKDKDGKIFEIDAIKDGEPITLKIKEGSAAAKKLVTFSGFTANTALSMDKAGEEYLVALKGITENADGYVTNVRLYDEDALVNQAAGKDMDGVISGTGITDKSKDDVVTLTKVNGGSDKTYTWSDNVTVAQYNDKSDKGEFSKSKMSSIKADSNDRYLAVMDDGVIIGLLTEYVAGDDKAPEGGVTSGIIKNKVANVDSIDAGYTISKTGKVTIDFTVDVPEYVPDNAVVNVTGDLYIDGDLDGALSLRVTGGTVKNGKATIRMTGSGYDHDWKLTLDNVAVSYDKVIVKYVDGDGKALSMKAGTTATATLPVSGTAADLKFTLNDRAYTGTGSYVVSGLNVADKAGTTAAAGSETTVDLTSPDAFAKGNGYVTVKVTGLTAAATTYVVDKTAVDGKALSTFGVKNSTDGAVKMNVTVPASINPGQSVDLKFKAASAITNDTTVYEYVLYVTINGAEYKVGALSASDASLTMDNVQSDLTISAARIDTVKKLAVDTDKSSWTKDQVVLVFNGDVNEATVKAAITKGTIADGGDLNKYTVSGNTVTITVKNGTKGEFAESDTLSLANTLQSKDDSGNKTAAGTITLAADGKITVA